jgi:hypothetical protein
MREQNPGPAILVPFSDASEGYQDIFIYLRPETNGVRVESCLLSVIQKDSFYRENLKLAYLANLPGRFILENRLIEEHYNLQLYFCTKGGGAFTPYMKKRFQNYFALPFEETKVIGGFDALKHMNVSAENLFEIRVPESDLLVLNGQSVKKIGDVYVVNYDIPALLKKNGMGTDIAVMILQSRLTEDEFWHMTRIMGKRLVSEEVIGANTPFSRAFHYSKGPFEEILDAVGFLYDTNGTHLPLKVVSFARYLLSRGLTLDDIYAIIKYPIFDFSLDYGIQVQEDIFSYTVGDSYDGAYEKLRSVINQYILR